MHKKMLINTLQNVKVGAYSVAQIFFCILLSTEKSY